MKNVLQIGLSMVLAVFVFVAPLNAEQIQNDFDSDGLSDLTLIKIEQGERLLWTKLASADGKRSQLGRLGAAGDHIILAHWLGLPAPQLGVVSFEDGAINWKIRGTDGESQKLSFGSKGDLVIAGGDFNGNGIADAAIIHTQENRYLWEIKTDMFAPVGDEPVHAFEFGTSTKSAFYASPDGFQDWAAVISKSRSGRNILRLRNVLTDEVRNVKRFGAYALKSRAFPVRGPDGVDVLGFQVQSKRRNVVIVRTLDGKSLGKFAIPARSTIVVGNFADDPGEEIAAHTDATMTVYNPFSGVLSKIESGEGIAVDQININSFSENNKPADPADPNGGDGGPIDTSACEAVRGWPSSHIYKTIGSSHFSSGDVRRNTVGLVISPGGSGPFPSCLTVLDTKGNTLAHLGLYARGDGWEARYYAGIGCGTDTPYNGSMLADKARDNTGSPNILFNFGSVCYGPIDAGDCVGSSQC